MRRDAFAAPLLEGALAQAWLEGPLPYTESRKLPANGKKLLATTAYRLGTRQADKLRAVDDAKLSFTNLASAEHAPKNLPWWDHVAQHCDLYSFRGGYRPVAMAKAHQADA